MRGGHLRTEGTVTDELWNAVVGTTDNHRFYIDDFDEVSTTVTQD